MSDLPITLLARRLLIRNQVFTVSLDHIRGRSGEKVPQYLTVAPNSPGTNGLAGVCILPVARECIGLLRVFRHPLGEYCLELPRGFIDANETALAAAQRELHEETGIDSAPAQFTSLGVYAPESGVLLAKMALYAAHLNECTGAHSNELGHEAFFWMPIAEFESRIAQGEIEDPAAHVAWLRLKLRGQDAHQPVRSCP